MSHKSQLTRRCLFSLPLAGAQLAAATTTPAAAVAAALKDIAFDPAQCWRVRDLSLAREDIKLYLSDGFVMLSKPLGDRPIAALFWAEVEGGDGEIIVLPPSAGHNLTPKQQKQQAAAIKAEKAAEAKAHKTEVAAAAKAAKVHQAAVAKAAHKATKTK